MDTTPPRGPLPPDVEDAARRIYDVVWGERYEPGRGPMHHAGGAYWHDELLRRADQWERMAVDARLCATVLPVADEATASDDQREAPDEGGTQGP